MSDSKADDAPRRTCIEWVKKRLLSHFSGAFVAGPAHVEYALALGFPKAMVRSGYDVVDNGHFAVTSDVPRRGFLASSRFIPKKNLPFLLRAHAAYRVLHAAIAPSEAPWDLMLLGDGPSRTSLEELSCRLSSRVIFRGFLQYRDLPAAYAEAGAFLHVSVTEQWGLVVNEAMAAGLPVLVSKRCGCVPDLVIDGMNGHALDPEDITGWATRMLEIARMPDAERSAMGELSRQVISGLSPRTHAEVAVDLAREALYRTAPRIKAFDALLLLAVLAWRYRN